VCVCVCSFVKPDDGSAYVKCFDAIAAAVAKANPSIVPLGPEICQPGVHNPDDLWHLNFIKHFLDPHNHATKAPPALASYHWLVNFDNGSLTRPFLNWDSALSGAVAELQKAKSNTTELILNEYIPYVLDWCSTSTATPTTHSGGTGSKCPDWQSPTTAGGDPDLQHAKGVGINRVTWAWNSAAASFAYIFGTLAQLGYKYVGIDQLVGAPWPDNQPPVAMIDWHTGEPNSKYFVTHLLATSIGTKTQKTLVASEVGTGIGNTSAISEIYSLAYIDSAGAKGIMLVNKGVGAVAVELAGIKSALARVVEVNVDVAEPGFEPIVKRTVGADGMLRLGPLAVAIVTGIA
jgi:hypothetical protein